MCKIITYANKKTLSHVWVKVLNYIIKNNTTCIQAEEKLFTNHEKLFQNFSCATPESVSVVQKVWSHNS